MNTSDVPFESLVATAESDLQAAYRIAGALTTGGLSRDEKRMVVHQWCAHMKRVIKPEGKKIPTPRRWL